jgi:hypothetical protein
MLKNRKSVITILFLALMIFLAWEFLQGESNSSQSLSTPTVAPDTSFELNIPSKALWKNYVVISAETPPGTNCRLTYVPPSGEVQVMDTVADISGLCLWRWKIEESQGKGSGRLIFMINGVSETHFIEIHSSF